MKTARELLAKAAGQFRFYEESHKAKAENFRSKKLAYPPGMKAEAIAHRQEQIDAALEKARVNGELAREIEDFLSAN